MTDQLDPTPFRALDSNGDPAPGAKAYFFAGNTGTPVTVYSDIAGTIAHRTPVVADGAGYFPQIFVNDSGNIKCTVTAADDSALPGYPMYPVVRVSTGGKTAAAVAFDTTSAVPADNVQDAIVAVQANVDAARAVVLSTSGLVTGGGDLTAGRTFSVTRPSVPEAQAGIVGTRACAPEDVRIYHDFAAPWPRYSQVTAAQTLTGAIPVDGSVPQISEGQQALTLTYTPVSTAHKLRIEYRVTFMPNATATLVAAVFISSQTDAVLAQAVAAASGTADSVTGVVYVTPPSLSPLTISVRLGMSTGDVTTPAPALFGVASNNLLEVVEVRQS